MRIRERQIDESIYRIAGRMFTLLFSFLLISCHDDAPVTNLAAGEEMTVRMTIYTPAPQLPRTKAVDPEENISEVQVLIFSLTGGDTEYRFRYGVRGTNVNSPNANTTVFTALLKTSPDPLKLILIANANEVVVNNYPAFGATEAEVKTLLVRSIDNGSGSPLPIETDLPMYGEHELPNLEAEGVNIDIKMLRAIARADVYNNDASGNFVMSSVQLFRPNNKIQLIPNVVGTNASGGPKVDSPSIPDLTGFYPVSSPMPEQSVGGNPSSSDNFIESLYLPEIEAPAPADQLSSATCIVVGGYFDDRTTQGTFYYRIDFNPDGYPLGEILRNHRYKFNIINVTSPGWDSAEEAAENAPSGISAAVEAWDENTTDMYFDGAHHYGVSTRHVKLQYRANSQAYIEVNTDLLGDLLQWVDADGNPLNSDPLATSLESARFKVTLEQQSGADDTPRKRILFEAKEASSGKSDYSEYMLIHVNRWKILITITQLPKRNSDETIRILTTNEIGCLGDNTGITGSNRDNLSGATYNDGIAMRAILDTHFGLGKTIDIKNINYTVVPFGVNAIDAALTYDVLAAQDIVYLVNNSRPSAATAQRILDWLAARKNRVLILGFDWKDPGINDNSSSGRPELGTSTNYQVLRLLRKDITPAWYNGGTNSAYGDYAGTREDIVTAFKLNADNEYLWKTGPFTSPSSENPSYTAVASCNHWLDDIWWGRADILNPDIKPLIQYFNAYRDDASGNRPPYNPNGSGDGKMIMGIDKEKRIVYVGDAEVFSTLDVPASTTGAANILKRASRINNRNGELNNDFSRVMANLWAWMIEEVVLGDNN